MQDDELDAAAQCDLPRALAAAAETELVVAELLTKNSSKKAMGWSDLKFQWKMWLESSNISYQMITSVDLSTI